MFRLIPHRALIDPNVSVVETKTSGDEATATLRVEGLLCSACAANVQRRLEGAAGVRTARVDLERGEACVTYEPDRATPEALVAAVEGAVILRPARRLLARLAHFVAGRASARRGQAEACPTDRKAG